MILQGIEWPRFWSACPTVEVIEDVHYTWHVVDLEICMWSFEAPPVEPLDRRLLQYLGPFGLVHYVCDVLMISCGDERELAL